MIFSFSFYSSASARCRAYPLLTSRAIMTDLPASCSMDGLAQLTLTHLATSLNVEFFCQVVQLITRTLLQSNVRIPCALGRHAGCTPFFTPLLVHCPGGNLLGAVF